MILTIDIGNTNIKAGVFKDNELIESFKVAALANKTSDEYWALSKDILRGRGIDVREVKGAIISSVNPNLNYTIENLISHNLDIKPFIVGAGVKTGMKIHYDNPRELGTDRLVGAVAAYNLYGFSVGARSLLGSEQNSGRSLTASKKNQNNHNFSLNSLVPLITVDCGTATTFNAISEKGEFLGGAISIGLKSCADGLSTAAAKLPKIELSPPATIINKTTISNMQAGVIYGFCGMVESIIMRMKQELGGRAKVVATGGLSEVIKGHTNIIDVVDRALTLKGLNYIYNLNA